MILSARDLNYKRSGDIKALLILRVLQQCKSERRFHADLLRCIVDFSPEGRKKV
jgi:hypothetical protein